MRRAPSLVFPILLTLALPAPSALAQPGQAPAAEESQDIVVEAQRSGAPMWEVRRGDSTVLLVGAIREVPKATPWRPEGLKRATRQAQTVILEPKVGFSAGAMFKVLFNMGRLVNLPKGKTRADYLTPEQIGRLEAIERSAGDSNPRRSFMVLSYQMLNKHLRYSKDAKSEISDIVGDAARAANIPVRPIGRLKGKDLVDGLFDAPPESHVRCLEATMSAVEAGQDIVLERGRAWTRFDIPAVMHSPLEIALDSCWPWTDTRFGPELRNQWIGEIDLALQRKGVTLAVVPLNVLAEDGGVLDRLAARQEDISGPAWRIAAGSSREAK
jgi:uncharacterized protein YbaP (TraB family)